MNLRNTLASVCILLTARCIAASDDPETLQANKAKAVAAARANDYEYLVTQHAESGKQPDSKIFRQWILDEINHESAMRDQIGGEIAEIEANGHNSNWLTSYYTREKEHRHRLDFTPDKLSIEPLGGRDGLYDYRAVLRASDGFHGGHSIISFYFEFRAKVEYFKPTQAYQITVAGYPTFQKKDQQEYDRDDKKTGPPDSEAGKENAKLEAEKWFRKADAELNSVYKQLQSKLGSTQAKDDLAKAQREWIAFRDAESTLRAGLSSGG